MLNLEMFNTLKIPQTNSVFGRKRQIWQNGTLDFLLDIFGCGGFPLKQQFCDWGVYKAFPKVPEKMTVLVLDTF